MEPIRRDVLKYAAGLAAGVVVTPVPWKLLDDVAIWSQNWSWLPKLPRGEVTERFTNCNLCPAACGVKAKCVAGHPFQLSGIAGHPVGRPTLCPLGLTAHHLPYAPLRIRAARVDGRTVPLTQAMDQAAALARESGGSLAVMGGVQTARGSMSTLGAMTGNSAFGIDYDNVATILSFGAPVLHGWSTPGAILRRRTEIKVIQIEASQSRTAAFADLWLPLRPGTEGFAALAIGGALLDQRLATMPSRAIDGAGYLGMLREHPWKEYAVKSGLDVERVATVARMLASGGPAIALAPPEEGALPHEASVAIAGLNVLMGSRAALTARRPAPASAEPADGSLALLVADSVTQIPPSVLRPKLAKHGKLIALSAWETDVTASADIVLPAPAWLEVDDEVRGAADAPVESLSLATAILPRPSATVTRGELLARLSLEDRAQETNTRNGKVFHYVDGSLTDAAGLSSDELREAIKDGGACWIGEKQTARLADRPVRLLNGIEPAAFRTALERSASAPGSRLAIGEALAPAPMLGKLFQESDLFSGGDAVRVNPADGHSKALAEGAAASVATPGGTGRAFVRLDPSLAPGMIVIDPGPAGRNGKGTALALCDPSADAWRRPEADVRRTS